MFPILKNKDYYYKNKDRFIELIIQYLDTEAYVNSTLYQDFSDILLEDPEEENLNEDEDDEEGEVADAKFAQAEIMIYTDNDMRDSTAPHIYTFFLNYFIMVMFTIIFTIYSFFSISLLFKFDPTCLQTLMATTQASLFDAEYRSIIYLLYGIAPTMTTSQEFALFDNYAYRNPYGFLRFNKYGDEYYETEIDHLGGICTESQSDAFRFNKKHPTTTQHDRIFFGYTSARPFPGGSCEMQAFKYMEYLLQHDPHKIVLGAKKLQKFKDVELLFRYTNYYRDSEEAELREQDPEKDDRVYYIQLVTDRYTLRNLYDGFFRKLAYIKNRSILEYHDTYIYVFDIILPDIKKMFSQYQSQFNK